MISNKHKVIFVHINKTGGTSIESLFSDKSLCSDQQSLKEIKCKIPEKKWDDFFKFSFVRNPWDRMVSEYFFRKESHKVNPKYWHCPKNLRIDLNISFKEWLLEDHDEPHSEFLRFQSQINWLIDDNNKIAVDFIGRFENLEKDIKHVTDSLSININFPHFNKMNRNHYSLYYDKDTIEIVRKRHQEDIDLFKYKFQNKYLL